MLRTLPTVLVFLLGYYLLFSVFHFAMETRMMPDNTLEHRVKHALRWPVEIF